MAMQPARHGARIKCRANGLDSTPQVAQQMSVARASAVSRIFDRKIFEAIYTRALLYNSCWEDPAVDRRALGLNANDTVLVITSAGCNALDYALEGPARIHAVDANPRQTALMELKLAGIRGLDFDDFFALFGAGAHREFEEIYRSVLRTELSPFARVYWDRHWRWFVPGLGEATFYGHGLLRAHVSGLSQAEARAERRHRGAGGCADARGAAGDLRKENFLALKSGLVDRVSAYTCTVTDFLWRTEEYVSKFVLLDHMVRMSAHDPVSLAEEWNAILARAAPASRVIFRSAHSWRAYLDHVEVEDGAGRRPLAEALRFYPDLAARLHANDRVHTYAGFHIADVVT
jgi:S-adenosylmethionine:diacylglycerol 3-amino-3-carboxypropyl transferase